MALSVSEQKELNDLRMNAGYLPPSQQARLVQLEGMATEAGVPGGGTTEGSKSVQSLSPTLAGLISDKVPLISTAPTMQAKLDEKNAQQTQPATTGTGGGKVDEPKKSFDIIKEMNNLAGKMNNMPAELQTQFKPRLDDINKTMMEFNQQYQADQASAKDAAEKAKNRAEWGSIASMLAKNIMGFSAALHGVDPNAMAYQTTDWAQQIKNANDELELNLSNLRENMKMKTEAKLGEKKDILSEMDDTFKAKMEGLRARAEGNKLRFTAEESEKDRLNKEALAATKSEGGTTVKTEDVAPKVQQALGKAADEKTMNAGVAELKSLAVQLGKDPNQIDSIIKEYQGTFDIGAPNEVAPEAQSKIAQYLSGTLTKTTTTSRGGAGQPAAGVVQSPDVKVLNGITYKKIGDKWVKQ